MTLQLGAVADDFTGATDLANNLVRSGMRTVQVIGVPTGNQLDGVTADAVVVALKSRTAPVPEAVEDSVNAVRALVDAGAKHIYFKYCSTFDSTDEGNIGPVIDALMELLGVEFTVAVPSFPELGRTVYQGHLFVNDQLLSETSMRNHPLTPMDDPNIVRVLAKQSSHAVGLVPETTVLSGSSEVRSAVDDLSGRQGIHIAVVDAVRDEDLHVLGSAFSNLRLVTGGSGLALGLAPSWSFTPTREAAALPAARGHTAVIAGSVSAATQAQVDAFLATGAPAHSLDLDSLARGEDIVPHLLKAVVDDLGRRPVLVYSTRSPEAVKAFQIAVGRQRASALIEGALARVAAGLVHHGVGALLVAGGETSGAVVQSLGVRALQIGAQIDPGVPWCAAEVDVGALHLALKSGNFGASDLFTRAFTQLDWREDRK